MQYVATHQCPKFRATMSNYIALFYADVFIDPYKKTLSTSIITRMSNVQCIAPVRETNHTLFSTMSMVDIRPIPCWLENIYVDT